MFLGSAGEERQCLLFTSHLKGLEVFMHSRFLKVGVEKKRALAKFKMLVIS